MVKNIKKNKNLKNEPIKDELNYNNLKYFVEKQITYKDTPNIHKLIKHGVFIYVIRNIDTSMGFIYLTPKKYFINSEILGKQLKFVELDFFKPIFIKKSISKNNIKYIEVKQSEDVSLIPKSYRKIFFTPVLLNYKYPYDIDNFKADYNKNIFRIHLNKVCFDKKDWFLDYFNIKTHFVKKIEKEILRGAKIDNKLRYVMITEFYNFYKNEFSHLIPHSIILTQGGTGKSSILGLLGYNLDNSSDAGIFGYYDVKRSSWNSGSVEKTNKAIVIDETNELINKKLKILDTLNKPLEQGIFQGGKAGNKAVKFGNQFIFLGNISNEFNFGNFVVGLSNNTLTIGRRFGFIIYDLNMSFENGTQRFKELPQYIEIFMRLLTFKFEEFYKNNKLYYLFNNHKKIQKRVMGFNKWFDNIKKEIENPDVFNFLNEFKKSISTRLVFMALQITFYENFEEYINNGIEKHIFMKKFYYIYEELIKIQQTQIENIIKHTNETSDIIKSNKILDDYNLLGNYSKNFIDMIILNKNILLKNKKLNYPNDFKEFETTEQKNKLQNLFKDIRRGKKSINKLNLDLNQFGLKLFINNETYYIAIINKLLFDKLILEVTPNKENTQKIGQIETEVIEVKEPPKSKEIDVIEFEEDFY